jgi:fatty acid elongase 3
MESFYALQHYIDNFSFAGLGSAGSFYVPLVGTFIYLAVIFGLQKVVERSAPMKLALVTALHNLFLCLLSLAMSLGIIYNLIPIYQSGSFLQAYCGKAGPVEPGVATHDFGAMSFWCCVFYFSKYYEMLDTVLLVLKKRPLTLVHVYHHFIVPYLFWGFLSTETSGQWSLAAANSLVHVFMYYYFMITTLGYTVWWKRYLTMMQIVQFFLDLGVTWPHLLFLRSFHIWECRGEMWTVYFGQAVGISFVYLFTEFYVKSYGSEEAAKHRTAEESRKRKEA